MFWVSCVEVIVTLLIKSIYKSYVTILKIKQVCKHGVSSVASIESQDNKV